MESAERVLIYGAVGGVGEALARRLHARGAELHLVGRKPEPLARLAEELGASSTVADVLDESSFDRVSAEAGTVTSLVYAVGSITLGSLARVSWPDAERDFRLNAWGALRAVQVSLPSLKKAPSASVLLFSSVAVQQGFPNHASIALAKGAVEGLTRQLAAELAPKVRVNCIAPSLLRTPLSAALTSSEPMAAAIAGLHPLPRLGEAEDVASLGAFLLSPEAGWITGQIIGVDGGRSSLRLKA